jgi:hypothetical protein
MKFEQMTFTAIHAGRVADRWKAGACARVPTPCAAISSLRSRWCRSRLVAEAVGKHLRGALDDDRAAFCAGNSTLIRAG